MAKVFVSTRLADRIDDATSSSISCRRARRATLSPRSAIARAYAAPTPSDAPAMRAHGPYRSTNSGSSVNAPPSAASAASMSFQPWVHHPNRHELWWVGQVSILATWNPVIETFRGSPMCMQAAQQALSALGQQPPSTTPNALWSTSDVSTGRRNSLTLHGTSVAGLRVSDNARGRASLGGEARPGDATIGRRRDHRLGDRRAGASCHTPIEGRA